MQGTELVVAMNLFLKWEFSHFNEKSVSCLCGNGCFGVWPRHNKQLF